MSNVFRRFHKATGNEYWDNAVEIEIQLTRFVMNEKNVPKKYRYVYAVPILRNVRSLQEAIVTATTIYPTTPDLAMEKKDAFQKAICANEIIIQAIQRMVLVLPIDVDKLDVIGERLLKESALLRKCRKSVRLQTEKQA